jgi:hypothetical protein
LFLPPGGIHYPHLYCQGVPARPCCSGPCRTPPAMWFMTTSA